MVRSKKEGYVTLKGAAPKLFNRGDKIHVLAYAYFEEAEAVGFEPRIIYADASNLLVEAKTYVFFKGVKFAEAAAVATLAVLYFYALLYLPGCAITCIAVRSGILPQPILR